MINQILEAGLQARQINFANRYAAAVIDKVQSVQELLGSQAAELIQNVAQGAAEVSADPNLGRNIDLVV